MASTKDKHEAGGVEDAGWLPQEPPPLLARSAGWMIVAVFLGALVAAVAVPLPEHVACRFRLLPEGGSDPVQTPVRGVLEAVRAAEGSLVAAGEILFEVRSDELLTWEQELRAAEEDLRATEQRTAQTAEAHGRLLALKETETAQVTQERLFREVHWQTVSNLVARTGELRKAGLVSEFEYNRSQLEMAAADRDLNVSVQSLNRIELEKARIGVARLLEEGEEAVTRMKLRSSIATLQRRLEGSSNGVLRIRAPFEAVVLDVPNQAPGTVVEAGRALCQLARVSARPVVEIALEQSGLDRVVAGQPVRLFFDAFPYQRYGTLTSRVDYVSPSAVTVGEGVQFRARAFLAQPEFRTERRKAPSGAAAGEVSMPVRVGMEGDARIRVGDRTLAEYFVEPLRMIRERL